MEENQTLEEFLEEASPADAEAQAAAEQARLSRRKFLTGAVAGGAAGLAVAAGTSVAVWKVSDGDLIAAQDAADAKLKAARDAADLELGELAESAAEEVAKLLGLIDLYEELDEIGLDGIIAKGLAALALPLEAVEAGAKALKSGLEWAEEALQSLADAVPTALESLLWLEAQVSALADAIENLEQGVARALDRATDNAVGEAVKAFTTKVLDALPFGLGDRFREALAGLVLLVTSVDDLVEGINTKLLEPLRQDWFSDQEDEGVSGSFLDPLVVKILDPLEGHLDSLASLADTVQNELTAPTARAMAKRTQLRAEIARYKDDYGLV
jgi:hypothetical protein